MADTLWSSQLDIWTWSSGRGCSWVISRQQVFKPLFSTSYRHYFYTGRTTNMVHESLRRKNKQIRPILKSKIGAVAGRHQDERLVTFQAKKKTNKSLPRHILPQNLSRFKAAGQSPCKRAKSGQFQVSPDNT